jgi:hypothetical protein
LAKWLIQESVKSFLAISRVATCTDRSQSREYANDDKNRSSGDITDPNYQFEPGMRHVRCFHCNLVFKSNIWLGRDRPLSFAIVAEPAGLLPRVSHSGGVLPHRDYLEEPPPKIAVT